jgi:RNase P/RNase MRP subunit p29
LYFWNTGRIDVGLREWLATGAPLDRQLQLRLLVEALDRAGRIVRVVPQPMVVAVGIEDQRALTELLLQAIGVELRLLLSNARIAPRSLCLDESQGLAIVAPEHVVHEALALLVGHASHFELAIARLVKRPARLPEQQVDEVVASFGFGVVMRVGLRRGHLLRLGHLGAQALQLVVERRLVGQQDGELFVPLGKIDLELAQLLERPLRNRGARQRVGIEGQVRRRARVSRVSVGEPVTHVKQFADRRQRIGRLHRPRAVHGLIAQRVDDPRLAEHRLARRGLEGRLVDERTQAVLVRQTQRRVVLVGPRHRQLQRAPGVETRRSRVRIHRCRGLGGRLVDRGPFGLEEGKRARHSGWRLSQYMSRFVAILYNPLIPRR